MWRPDRALAELMSWRCAARLVHDHPGIAIEWERGTRSGGNVVMVVAGTGRSGPFQLLLNRTLGR